MGKPLPVKLLRKSVISVLKIICGAMGIFTLVYMSRNTEDPTKPSRPLIPSICGQGSSLVAGCCNFFRIGVPLYGLATYEL